MTRVKQGSDRRGSAIQRYVKASGAVLQELERDRLVHRRSDRKDGRRTRLGLSSKGRRLFAEIHERSHVLERSLSAVISADEMAAAVTVLAKLRAFVEGLR